MKIFTEQQIDDMIKLRYGRLVDGAHHPTLTSNAAIGKVFKVSGTKIRQLYMGRFEKLRRLNEPLLRRLQRAQQEQPRRRWGL